MLVTKKRRAILALLPGFASKRQAIEELGRLLREGGPIKTTAGTVASEVDGLFVAGLIAEEDGRPQLTVAGKDALSRKRPFFFPKVPKNLSLNHPAASKKLRKDGRRKVRERERNIRRATKRGG